MKRKHAERDREIARLRFVVPKALRITPAAHRKKVKQLRDQLWLYTLSSRLLGRPADADEWEALLDAIDAFPSNRGRFVHGKKRSGAA